MFENGESFQNLVQVLAQGGLIILFYAVIWTLGTKDRKKTIKLLHRVIHLLDSNGNGNGKSLEKGGDTHECNDGKNDS